MKKLAPPPAPRAPRARRRRVRAGRAVRAGPLQRRAHQPLPDRRRVAVPPRPGQHRALRDRFMRQTSTEGWTPTTVPNAWNAGDETPESMQGTVGWYRKDFRLPSSAARYDWILRFESVNYRTRGLAQRQADRQEHAAPTCPFELRHPGERAAARRRQPARRAGRQRPRAASTCRPRASAAPRSRPAAGGTTAGSCARSTSRRAERVAINTVQVLPNLPCRTCAATVTARVTVRNLTDRTQPCRPPGRFGSQPFRLGRKRVPPTGFATFTDAIRVGCPRLWTPRAPVALLDLVRAQRRRAHGRRLPRPHRHPLGEGHQRPS